MSAQKRRRSIPFITVILTLLITLGSIFLLFILFSSDPVRAMRLFLTGPFSSVYAFGGMLSQMGIMVLAGTGICLSYRGGLFNLGGEGQIYTGATASALIALALPVLIPGPLGVLLIIMMAALIGGAIAGLSGFLKFHLGIHELISSFLLSGTLVYLNDYLITYLFRDTSSYLITTRTIPVRFMLTDLLPPSTLSVAFPVALTAAVVAGFWLFKTPGGYELRMFGRNPSFAAFGGISIRRMSVLPLALSGACYGMAGALMVLGNQHAAILDFTEGLGWNGIVVALIAGLDPWLTIPAGLVLAWLESGSRAAMAGSSVSFELSSIIQGMLLFFITLRFVGRKPQAIRRRAI